MWCVPSTFGHTQIHTILLTWSSRKAWLLIKIFAIISLEKSGRKLPKSWSKVMPFYSIYLYTSWIKDYSNINWFNAVSILILVSFFKENMFNVSFIVFGIMYVCQYTLRNLKTPKSVWTNKILVKNTSFYINYFCKQEPGLLNNGLKRV